MGIETFYWDGLILILPHFDERDTLRNAFLLELIGFAKPKLLYIYFSIVELGYQSITLWQAVSHSSFRSWSNDFFWKLQFSLAGFQFLAFISP